MFKKVFLVVWTSGVALGANALTLSTHVSHLGLAAQGAQPWTEAGAAIHLKESLLPGVKQFGGSVTEHNRYGLRAQDVQVYAVTELSQETAVELTVKSGSGAEYLARAAAALTVYKALPAGVEGAATYAHSKYASDSNRALSLTLAKDIGTWRVELGHSQELAAHSSVQKVKLQRNFQGRKLSLAYYAGDELARVPLQAPKLLPVQSAVLSYTQPVYKNLDVALSWQHHWKTQARSGLTASLTYAFE